MWCLAFALFFANFSPVLLSVAYIKKRIFPEKSYTKCGGETISRPFSKKSKLSISLDQKFYTV